ncbi:unnamed protein product, partial [Didymodactylos carnosus]
NQAILLVVFKPLPIWSIIVVSNIYFFENFKHIPRTTYLYIHIAFGFLLAALLFGSFGDIVLEIPTSSDNNYFLYGTLLFLFGHICYIICYSICARETNERQLSCSCNFWIDFVYGWPYLLIVLLFGSVMFLFLYSYQQQLSTVLLIGIALYDLVLCLLLWRMSQTIRNSLIIKYSRATQQQANIYQYIRFIGAFLFVISDSTNSIAKFVPVIKLDMALRNLIVMITYYIAQYLLAYSFKEYYLEPDMPL